MLTSTLNLTRYTSRAFKLLTKFLKIEKWSSNWSYSTGFRRRMVLKDDPNHCDLTTKLLYLVTVFIGVHPVIAAKYAPLPTHMKLDDPCRSSLECLLFVQHSFCDWDERICSCQSYHIRYNDTACLPASLLGFGCAVDEQCTLKVPNSECINGLCQCQPNHVPLRRDKCLPPATVGDYCLNDVQCHLSSSFSYCKYIIPRIYGKCQCPYGYLVTEDDKCLPYLENKCQSNEDCEYATPNSYCQQQKGKESICSCRHGYHISKNKMFCQPDVEEGESLVLSIKEDVAPVSLGKSCKSHSECQVRDPYSSCIDGICECIKPTPNCNSDNRGCHNDTFQCRNGQCISWYYVCDKETNCPDNSDEDECVPFKCPKEAFQCNDGTCLSRGLVCNGRWECPDGSDEARCYKGIPCDEKAHRCSNGQCLPQYSFCNAVSDCADGSDETFEVCQKGVTCPSTNFRCKNNRCRSTAILCSGMDGCGDNSDETDCEICYCEKP